MSRMILLCALLEFTALVLCQKTENFTVTVPVGTSHHGDPTLICTPINWYQILIFYFGNYVAHAATVRIRPGETQGEIALALLSALILPHAGLYRGLSGIYHRAILKGKAFKGGHLHKAARAGALCVVMRSNDWKPSIAKRGLTDVRIVPGTVSRLEPTQDDSEALELEEQNINVRRYDAHYRLCDPNSTAYTGNERSIHGVYKLPKGYAFSTLPREAIVDPISTDDDAASGKETKISLSSSFNAPAALIAIVQIIYASLTLYHSRGDQLTQFGYAAFGLTVIPYVIMSFLNLVGTLLTPNYNSLYMVRSREMEEAEAAGGFFEGVVGTVKQVDPATTQERATATVESTGEVITMPSLPTSVCANKDGHLVKRTPAVEDEGLSEVPADGYQFNIVAYSPRSKLASLLIPRYSNLEIDERNKIGTWEYVFLVSILLAATIAPFVIIYSLTSFDPGQSTTAERAWTMTWLVFGIFFGSYSCFMMFFSHEDARLGVASGFNAYISLMCISPAIGGFVVVGQMLKSFGNCVQVGA